MEIFNDSMFAFKRNTFSSAAVSHLLPGTVGAGEKGEGGGESQWLGRSSISTSSGSCDHV